MDAKKKQKKKRRKCFMLPSECTAHDGKIIGTNSWSADLSIVYSCPLSWCKSTQMYHNVIFLRAIYVETPPEEVGVEDRDAKMKTGKWKKDIKPKPWKPYAPRSVQCHCFCHSHSGFQHRSRVPPDKEKIIWSILHVEHLGHSNLSSSLLKP